MITKLRLSPLDSFNTIALSRTRPKECALTVSKNSIRMNQDCYHHFHGHQYFKFMMRTHYLAVVAVSKDDPDALKNAVRCYPKRNHHGYYDVLVNKGLQKRILARIAEPPGKHAIRLKVDKKHVSPKYLIFDMDND